MIARLSITAVLAACAAAWLAAPAVAEDDERVVIVNPPLAERSYVPAANEQVLTGKISKIETRKDAAGVEHRVARLDIDDDQRFLVDLGPKSSLKDIDLDHGDTITVHAVPGTFNGRAMFIAHRVQDDDGRVAILALTPVRTIRTYGDVIYIERPRATAIAPSTPVPATPTPAMPAPSAQTRTIEGRVTDTWTADVPGYGQVLMAHVRTTDGAIYNVDLGLRNNLPAGFALPRDSWIQVTGPIVQSGNQEVLQATNLSRSLQVR